MKDKGFNVLVFGGTGYYGTQIVKSFRKKEVNVSVVSRNSDKIFALFGDKVTAVQGDVRDASFIREVVKDQDALVIALSAMTWDLIKYQKAIERDAVLQIIEQAQQNNCRKLIYLSGYEIRMDVLKELGIEKLGRIKFEIEQTLTQSGLNYTILGCPPSFKLFFSLLKNGKITIPGGAKKPFPSVAAEDVGEITAQCVFRPDLSGKRLRIPGSKAYSVPDFASLLKNVTGMEIQFREVPLQAVNVVSRLLQPFHPFMRELYMSLKLLNNFPEDLAAGVEEDHRKLLNLFDYESHSLISEIKRRWESGIL